MSKSPELGRNYDAPTGKLWREITEEEKRTIGGWRLIVNGKPIYLRPIVICEQPPTGDTKLLGELLAMIHGDGGHYQSEHGTHKAVADAIKKVCDLRARIPESQF